MFTNHIYLIYMYKQDLVLNDLQLLRCHKTQPNQTKPIFSIRIKTEKEKTATQQTV